MLICQSKTSCRLQVIVRRILLYRLGREYNFYLLLVEFTVRLRKVT